MAVSLSDLRTDRSLLLTNILNAIRFSFLLDATIPIAYWEAQFAEFLAAQESSCVREDGCILEWKRLRTEVAVA
jgi:hypothetical protein